MKIKYFRRFTMTNHCNEKIQKANSIMEYLKKHPKVKECTLQGSLSKGNHDQYSDIDIHIDVSGYDNGKFMLQLPEIISAKYPIAYTAYAPGLFPNIYVVSFGLKNDDIFSFIDFECIAKPHVKTITLDDIRRKNNINHLFLKLTIANTKYILRGINCSEQIKKIASHYFSPEDIATQCDKDLIVKTLHWFEKNCDETIRAIASSCISYL